MTSSLLMAGCQVSGTLLASHFSFHDKLGREALICILQIALEGRQAKPSQNSGPTSPYFVHDCLVQKGQGKSVWWAFLASCLVHFSLRKALPGFFPLYFHLGLPALGTDLKSRKGPYSRRFSYTKCPHAKANPVWLVRVLWALSFSLSRIVRNSIHRALP